MNANEFIQNVFKGENIDACENHFKSYLKEKVKSLIPDHLIEYEKYKKITQAHKNIKI